MSPPLTPPFASTAAQPAAHAPTPAFVGFDFFPFFGAARSAAAPEPVPGLASLGPMGHWAAPVYDVDELDKRIRDLRTVHFWLEQNTKALALTIQTLEVQKMTLVTLKGMNLGLQEIAQAFTLKPEQRPDTTSTAASPGNAASPDSAQAASVTADALQWWNALGTQFQTIATDTLRDLAAQAGRNAEAASAAVAAVVTPTPATDEAELPATPQAGPEVDHTSQAAPAPTDATPHANVASQTAPPKPRKRPPPAPRATRASS